MSQEVRKVWQAKQIRNGVATLTFCAHQLSDVIHPFSLPDYELPSEHLVSFLEHYRPVLPKKVPLLLKIVGTSFSREEEERIDTAIWTYFCLRLEEAKKAWEECLHRMLMHLVCLVLSSVLLFAVQSIDNTLLVNLAYLPFWFFAYRFLTHLMLDCAPIWRDYQWNRRLASLKLAFPQNPPSSELLTPETIREYTHHYEKEANEAVWRNGFAKEYYMDHGVVSLGCMVKTLEDVLSPSDPLEEPFLSDELAAYLSQTASIVNIHAGIQLEIAGGNFSEENQTVIREGLRRYFRYRMAEEDLERRNNRVKIYLFSGSMVISMLLILLWEKGLDVAEHEFALILLWFFGDYLLEFLLLSTHNILDERKKWEAFSKMKVIFK